jgi:hypothetical protein
MKVAQQMKLHYLQFLLCFGAHVEYMIALPIIDPELFMMPPQRLCMVPVLVMMPEL